MSDLNWEKVETIIDEVLDLPQNQRLIYIEHVCGHDPNLKTKVKQLVDSIFDSEGWLEELKNDFNTDISSDLELREEASGFIGKQVGSYTIKEQIGQGGMGVVFRAERTEDTFDQQVAIKFIRHNQATKTNIERFKREQHILAGLSHSGIAQLYDGGISAEGFPYIIMEYVNGVPLNEYCAQHHTTIKERITLFKQVLEAVRYAYENLIIHRDLKPGNILVDSNGEIKILDFGISKLLQEETDLSLTYTGARILTPKYAAPEQIKQTGITTATDLYSLGVVFYELLTDKSPFDLDDCSAYEAEQIILNQPPVSPSSRVLERRISRQLSGDLNAIALKAIRKEPMQRYRVANEFDEDLDNYLKGLPVSARIDSVQYRTYKFFARHKQSLTIAGLLIILIFVFFAFYTVRVTEERNKARLEAQKAGAVTNFLTGLIEANAPGNTQGKTVTIRQFLESGFEEVQQLTETPVVQAEVLTTMGYTYRSLGDIQKAATLIDSALDILKREDIRNMQMAKSYNTYGIIQRDLGNYGEAQQALQQSIDMYHLIGETNGEDHAKSLRDLAYIERLRENFEEASQLIQKALDIENRLYDKPNIKMAETLFIYASILRYQDKYSKAIEIQKQSLAMVRKVVEGPHPGVATNLTNLANLYDINGEADKSTKYYKKALRMAETLYGDQHGEIANINSGLGGNYLEAGRLDSAEYHLQKAIDVQQNVNPESPLLGNMYNKYAHIFAERDQFIKADSLLLIAENTLGNSQSDLITVKINRAYIALQLRQLTKAESVLDEVFQINRDPAPSLQQRMEELSELITQRNDQAISDFQPNYIR
jgi:serine/threonine-protein kinase